VPVGPYDSYFLRWSRPEEEGDSLEEALAQLQAFWLSRPSLVVHQMGNLVITLQIGSTEIQLEITDPVVLDRFQEEGPGPVLDHLIAESGLSREEAMLLIEESRAHVIVDALRVPDDPDAWRPGKTYSKEYKREMGAEAPQQAWRDGAPRMMGELVKDIDARTRRATGRPRSRQAQALIRAAIEHGRKQGMSDGQISQLTGVPRSTIRDARIRMERVERVEQTFGRRQPGQRLTPNQREVVLQSLVENQDNAAKTARDLGLAPRTVRDIRMKANVEARRVEQPSFARDEGVVRQRWTPDQRSQVLREARDKGISVTEAGRIYGVPGRTARDWGRKVRRGEMEVD